MLLSRIARSRLAAFEREWNYDTSYMRDILSAGFGALRPLLGLGRMAAFRRGVPAAPWFAAKLAATRAEDCGPCLQLVVTMAERAGVAEPVLRALLAGDAAGVPEDVALGWRFARAALAHDPAADDLRAEIERRWGRAGLVSLAYAIAVSRVYPTLKYALGHGRACALVRVGAHESAVAPAPAAQTR
jgi:hypothetical protein